MKNKIISHNFSVIEFRAEILYYRQQTTIYEKAKSADNAVLRLRYFFFI